MLRAILVVALLNAAAPVQGGDGAPRVDRRIDFDRDVRPILAEHCHACHGRSKQKGGCGSIASSRPSRVATAVQ